MHTTQVVPSRAHWDSDESARLHHGHELTMWEPIRPAATTTTHRHDFLGVGQRNAWPSKYTTPRFERKFEGESTYRSAYKAWPTNPMQPHGPGTLAAKSFPFLGTTTANDSYRYPKPKDRTQRRPDRPEAASHPFKGTSTMMDDYRPWPVQARHAGKEAPEIKSIPFQGATIAHDYKWPKAATTRSKRDKQISAPKQPFDGLSEYNAKYTNIPLPKGLPCNLGLQVASKPYAYGGIGGQFLSMIAAGTPTPVIVTKDLTTVQDMQQLANIIVIAKRDDYADGIELGRFTMEGIKPAKVATQRVTVTYKLLNEQTLQCSATYKEGNRTVNLTFRDSRPLRSDPS